MASSAPDHLRTPGLISNRPCYEGINYAYNPYCAYNEQGSCPLTPFENRLRVPIRAGEKDFKYTT